MNNIKDQTRITQWGNSKATRISSYIVKQLGLEDNQVLSVTIQNNSIILTPIKKQPTNIHDLFAGWQDDGQRDHELDWGKEEGNELPW